MTVSRFPTRINSTIIFPFTFRFLVNNTISTATTVLYSNLLNLWVFNINSTQAINVIGSMKIQKVEMWSSQFVSGGSSLTSVGSFSGIGIEWLSTQGQSKITQDYGDINRPAHVSSRPPTKSLAGDWFNILNLPSQSVSLFKLFGATIGQTGISASSPLPPGTIVDVHTVLTVLNTSDGSSGNAITTVAANTQSNFRGLDNLALASSAYAVTGYPQV